MGVRVRVRVRLELGWGWKEGVKGCGLVLLRMEKIVHVLACNKRAWWEVS